MGKYINIEYVDWGKMKEHLFGDANIGNCAMCGEYKSLDPHHKVTQSRGGNEGDIINVCRECHNWIGQNPSEASKKGLYIKGYKINEK